MLNRSFLIVLPMSSQDKLQLKQRLYGQLQNQGIREELHVLGRIVF
jgi:hypothetical protein